MQKVGVEAVVEGLGAFIRDTGRMNSALDKLRPQGTLLQRAFSGITETLAGFGREILNVAEYALGHLLAEAIQFVIQKIGELISATIEAGAEFQTMELRLTRLNFNSLIESGDTYKQAMRAATEVTKEQLTWIQKLAVTTPYDAQDIANVFTLARSYGFAADESKKLTEDISNFAAGMGLGNVEIERIIVNFGQMVQQGKVTQREMNDLARGAFVPVNDIIERMGKNVAKLSEKDLTALSASTGLTVDQLAHMADGTDEANKSMTKFRSSTEGVNAFMQAFSDVVDERFTGAAEGMARTFKGASDNAKDLVKSLIGFGVVRPVLDAIGGRIADLITSLTEEKNWENLTKAAEHVGTAISTILSDLFGKLPGTDDLASGIISGLEGIATWLDDNHFKILTFFENIGKTIQDKVIPFVNNVVDAFNTIRDWVTENGETIKTFFTTLGEVVGTVFDNLFGGGGAKGAKGESGLDGLLEGITTFMQYVIDNKDKIAEWVTWIVQIVFWFQVLITVLSIVGGFLLVLAGFFLGIIAAVAGVISFISALLALLAVPFVAVFAIVVAAIGFVIAMFVLAGSIVYYFWDTIVAVVAGVLDSFGDLVVGVVLSLLLFVAKIEESVEAAKTAFTEAPWGSIGRGIIDGVRQGVVHAAGSLAAAAVAAVRAAIDAAKAALGIQSPSTEGIFIGEMTMMGITQGIERGARQAMQAMESAVKMVAMPAMSLPALTQQFAVAMPGGVSTTNHHTNNFNLTVNSGAPTEPILQDYNMMQSLIQG